MSKHLGELNADTFFCECGVTGRDGDSCRHFQYEVPAHEVRDVAIVKRVRIGLGVLVGLVIVLAIFWMAGGMPKIK